jgi:ClpP class serine protease
VQGILDARAAGLQVISHTSSEALSAGYRLAVAADKLYAARDAELGSIGVVAVHHDISKRMEMMGHNVTVLRLGPEKALGTPYEPLEGKARDALLTRMERARDSFLSDVSLHRNLPMDYLKESAGSGAVFSSEEALAMRLIDDIKTFNDVINSARTTAPAGSQTGAYAMSKTPMTAEAKAELAASAAAVDPNIVLEDTEETEEQEAVEAPEPAQAAEPVQAQATHESAGISQLLSELNEKLVQANVELAQVKAERDSSQAILQQYRGIVISHTRNLRIKLGLPADDTLADAADSAVVAQHESAHSQFVTRFAAGPVSKPPTQESKLPTEVVTRFEEAAKKATAIGRK